MILKASTYLLLRAKSKRSVGQPTDTNSKICDFYIIVVNDRERHRFGFLTGKNDWREWLKLAECMRWSARIGITLAESLWESARIGITIVESLWETARIGVKLAESLWESARIVSSPKYCVK